MKAVKGDWVRVHRVVMEANERSANLPEDTKMVPLEMWDKGFLVNRTAVIGDQVVVETIIGRSILGKLVEIDSVFDINYGSCVTETLYIGKQLREMLGE